MFYHIICKNLSRKEISEDLEAFFHRIKWTKHVLKLQKNQGEKRGVMVALPSFCEILH